MARITISIGLLSLTAPSLAGPLTPPAGPVAPSGRFGPRIEVNAQNTPGDADSTFRIAQPGSYYLTGDLVGEAGKRGIEIVSSDVAIDLMGFRLRGVANSLDGIGAASARNNLAIHDGVITDWDGDGINLDFAGEGALIQRIHTRFNGGAGIRAMRYSIVESCTAIRNDGAGIVVGEQSIVEESICNVNDLDGFSLSTGSSITACTSQFNGRDGITAGGSCTVTHCASGGNGSDGIFTSGNTVIVGCAAAGNAETGIRCQGGALIVSCSASSNTLGGFDVNDFSAVLDCYADGNGVAGIILGDKSTAQGCTVRFSTNGDGITAEMRNFIQGNAVYGVGATSSGIRLTGAGNRVDHNFATSGLRGFLATSGNNLFTRNAATGNNFNYDLNSNNFARVVAATPSGGIVGDAGGVAVAPEDPLINIAY